MGEQSYIVHVGDFQVKILHRSLAGVGGWDTAEYPASIFGTEKGKVSCSFYFKTGACRHGDRCSRLHNKPTFSQTIGLLNISPNPQNSSQSADGLRCAVSDAEMQEHCDEFFEEIFTEMEEKYGEAEETNVCDKLGGHLVGSVYGKFRREADAEKAVTDLNNRWFNGQPSHAEPSPETDFRGACRHGRMLARRLLRLHAFEAHFQRAAAGAVWAASQEA
ncbi:hypothetical protein H8959_016504 [Pygathrix nigripes]